MPQLTLYSILSGTLNTDKIALHMYRIVFLVGAFFFLTNSSGQTYCPTANMTDSTIYFADSAKTRRDPIYIFRRDSTNVTVNADSLPNANNYEWQFIYTHVENNTFKDSTIQSGQSTWQLTIPDSLFTVYDKIRNAVGVIVKEQGQPNDSSMCWVIRDFKADDIFIVDVDGNGAKIDTFPKTCGIEVKSSLRNNIRLSFRYYNKKYVERYYAKYKSQISSEPSFTNEVFTGDYYSKLGDKTMYESTYYYHRVILTVDEKEQSIGRDSAYWRSYIPGNDKELFKVDYKSLVDSAFYPDKPEWYYKAYDTNYNNKVSAPALFRIEPDLKNTDELEWRVYVDLNKDEQYTDDPLTDSVLFDTTVTDAELKLEITFQYPGDQYRVDLTAKNIQIDNEGCEVEESINVEVVEPATLTPVNYIKVPGEGRFRFTDVSIESISIQIFNRNGNLVHEYDGYYRDWPGWDGRVKNSNRYVPSGVYFYVASYNHLIDYRFYLQPEAKEILTNEYEYVEDKVIHITLGDGNTSSQSGGTSGGSGNLDTGNTSSGSTGGNAQESDRSILDKGFLHVFNNNN